MDPQFVTELLAYLGALGDIEAQQRCLREREQRERRIEARRRGRGRRR